MAENNIAKTLQGLGIALEDFRKLDAGAQDAVLNDPTSAMRQRWDQSPVAGTMIGRAPVMDTSSPALYQNRVRAAFNDPKINLRAAPAAMQEPVRDAAPVVSKEKAPVTEKAPSFQDVMKGLGISLQQAPNQRRAASPKSLMMTGYEVKAFAPILNQVISSATSTATSRPRVGAKEAAMEMLIPEIMSPSPVDIDGNPRTIEQMQASAQQAIDLYKMIAGIKETDVERLMSMQDAANQ